MDKLYVSDLKSGQEINSVFAVAKKDFMKFKDTTKGEYLSMQLSDKTGTIEAKKWNDNEGLHNLFEVGSIIRVKGNIDEFKGNLQLNIKSINLPLQIEIDMKDFIPSSGRDLKIMENELIAGLNVVENPSMKAFLLDWFSDSDFIKAYTLAPAAKTVHHAYVGGLMEHSLEAMKIGLLLQQLYPNTDRDIIIAGSLLHDVGKIEEYICKTIIDLSDTGKLMGHTVLGYKMLTNRAIKNGLQNCAWLDHIGHVILSHHGEIEYGAPILPQTIEANIVHYSDLTSGRIKQVSQSMQKSDLSNENWSPYDRLLNRSIFKGFTD